MNFLKRMIIKWARDDEDDCIPTATTARLRVSSTSSVEMDRSIHFQVLPAVGGAVVQIRKYDNRKDENHYSTYVIPEGQDIAKEVGNIVSLEILRNG